MHKKVVHTVARHALNAMVLPGNISNVFFVSSVIEHLSGKSQATALIANVIGLNYGLQKATISGSYAIYRDSAISNSKVSKIIGLSNYQKNSLIIDNTDTLFMMPLIFTKMAA